MTDETMLVRILDNALRLMSCEDETRLAERVHAMGDMPVLCALLLGPEATVATKAFACKVLRAHVVGPTADAAQYLLTTAILRGDIGAAFEAASVVGELELPGFAAAARTRLESGADEPFWLRDELQEIINNEEK